MQQRGERRFVVSLPFDGLINEPAESAKEVTDAAAEATYDTIDHSYGSEASKVARGTFPLPCQIPSFPVLLSPSPSAYADSFFNRRRRDRIECRGCRRRCDARHLGLQAWI